MEVTITLIPASGDPDTESAAYQRELADFANSLKKAGIEYEAKPGKLLLTDRSLFILGGSFLISITYALRPVLVAAVEAWLHGLYGRKYLLEISKGKIKAEAPTATELDKIWKLADETQQRNQPKVIRKP